MEMSTTAQDGRFEWRYPLSEWAWVFDHFPPLAGPASAAAAPSGALRGASGREVNEDSHGLERRSFEWGEGFDGTIAKTRTVSWPPSPLPRGGPAWKDSEDPHGLMKETFEWAAAPGRRAA
eukprot:scaffold443_cov527-Prasinococcus_capsulatus_cf.AAC.12